LGRRGDAPGDPARTHHIREQDIMTKERKSNREDKKKPAMTPKEKKAAKKSKKELKDFIGTDRRH
jgi:hypothetical protein